MAYRIITLILLLANSLSAQASLFNSLPQSQFVTANQAFAFDFSQQHDQLTLSWKIKPGYYLYRQKN